VVAGSVAFLPRSSAPEFVMRQEKRFWVALVMYAVLAVLAWTTMDNSPVQIGSNQISLRGLTLVILGFFAARTILHWRAEKIRAEKME